VATKSQKRCLKEFAKNRKEFVNESVEFVKEFIKEFVKALLKCLPSLQ